MINREYMKSLLGKMLIGALLMVLPTITMVVIYLAWSTEHLHTHGIRTEAMALDIYTECGKHGCYDLVDYKFKPRGQEEYTLGYGSIGQNYSNNTNISYVHAHRSLPIAYDATYPARSAVNFGDEAMQPMSFWGSIFIIFMICVSAYSSVVFAIIFLRKKSPQPDGYDQ